MKKQLLCGVLFLGVFAFSSVLKADLIYSSIPVSGVSRSFVNTSISSSSGALLLLAYGFRTTAVQSSIVAEVGSDLTMTTTQTSDLAALTEATLQGKVLNYPNPFQATVGTTIGYTLSKNMDVELKFFDMMGNMIGSIEKPAGSLGGLRGLNKVPIASNQFGGTLLSAGVYFYLLLHQGKVLGKGKMAVIP